MKCLLVGLGSIGQRHARNLRRLLGSEVELLAYRATRHSPALRPDMTVMPDSTVEQAYGIRSCDRLEEALDEKPDAVFVANPNSLHVPVALRAARAGCHLFIEKPLSDSLEGVHELVTIAERQKLVAFVAYQFRFHPGLKWIKSLLDDRRLGRLVAAHIVNGEYLPDWHPYEDYRRSHAARRDLGGGSLRIQTHELDYALWLFGMPQSVYAVGGQLSRLEVDVEDSVSLLMAGLDEDRRFPVHVHLDYLQRPPQRVCEIVGDAGKVRYDFYANRVVWHDRTGDTLQTVEFPNFDRNQMFVDELRHFLACLRGEAQPIVDLHEAIRSLRVSLAAEESLKKGCVSACAA